VRAPLPEFVRRALADPFSLGDTGANWKPPAVPLDMAEIEHAIEHLEWKLIPAGPEGVATVMALMLEGGLAFAKDDDSNWERRTLIYQAALDDMPADLLELAAIRVIKSTAFFPQAAVLRQHVDREFFERGRMLQRAKRLKQDAKTPGQKAEEFQREPEQVRLAGMVANFTRHGLPGRAAKPIADLWALAEAERAKPSPASWATDGFVDVKLKTRVEGKWTDETFRVEVVKPKDDVVGMDLASGPHITVKAKMVDGRVIDVEVTPHHELTGKSADFIVADDVTRVGPNVTDVEEEPPPHSEEPAGDQALDW